MANSDIENILESLQIRPTANRILVVKELSQATHPVSLADIEASLNYSMDKASIFRVLELFAAKDLVHVIEDGSRALKYELCHNGAHHSIDDQHVHFYCERCHETYCLESVNIPSVAIPEGYRPHAVNYLIKGLCPKCAK